MNVPVDRGRAAEAWCCAYAQRAGAPAGFSLLAHSPVHACPAWRAGGSSFAASALLASSQPSGVLPRVFWRLGLRNAFFAAGTVMMPADTWHLRATHTVPATLAYVLPATPQASQARAGSPGVCSPELAVRGPSPTQAERLARALAADMQPCAVRLLGFVLARLFRRGARRRWRLTERSVLAVIHMTCTSAT